MAVTQGLVLLSTFLLGIVAFRVYTKVRKDPFGLFHLPFNVLPGDDPKRPKTEWLNMGFWKDTDVFPEACQALAVKLNQAAKCQVEDRVLDVGHGTGESLILLMSGVSVPRPSSITGITSLPVHYLRSKKRVDRLRASSQTTLPPVRLYEGDAVFKGQATNQSSFRHPLDPSSADVFDVILALDCAMHFDTREAFLRQSFHKLAPGGRVALADICYLPQRRVGSPLERFIHSVFPIMPKQNMMSMEGYVALMKEIGYVDVELENITPHVFPGFLKFLRSRGMAWQVFSWVWEEFYVKTGAKFVIVNGTAPPVI